MPGFKVLQMSAFRLAISIWPLFFGLALIGISIGMQGSLLGIRAELEGFNDFLIGFLMSAYFGGFLLGSLLAPKHIKRVGHIRIFGALSLCNCINYNIGACNICKSMGMDINEIFIWFCFLNYLCGCRKIAQQTNLIADKYYQFMQPLFCLGFALDNFC